MSARVHLYAGVAPVAAQQGPGGGGGPGPEEDQTLELRHRDRDPGDQGGGGAGPEPETGTWDTIRRVLRHQPTRSAALIAV